MSRFLVLLPAPEAQWAQLPASEHAKGEAAHRRFNERLRAGDHRVLVSSPLAPSAEAVSMRPDGAGGVLVSDGPFTESTEQIVGFYLIESDDEADLLMVCRGLASTGDLIELRRLVEPEEGQS